MKYALITGSSGGVSEEMIKILIENGIFCIGLDINDNNYKNDNFKFIKCDLLDNDSIIKAKEIIMSITNHIDYVLNLAGIFYLKSIVEGDEESLKKIIDINFFGTYRINKIFLDLLDQKSKILIFSSEVALYSPQPFNGYYSLSKIILDKYADILRRELNYLNIKVIKVEAGAIKTKLLNGVNKEYQELLNNSIYYKKPLTKLKKLMDNEINKETSPKLIASKLYKIINKKHPKISYRIKNSFKLRFLNSLPEKLQDIIYLNVIK